MKHYLDYAATTAVRPPTVAEAVSAFLCNVGATPGRGGHSLSVESARIAFRCRRALCKVVGLSGDPGRIAFMFNATHALNTALWGVLGEGDAVVVSPFDHNAVLRPVTYLGRQRSVEVRMLEGSPDGAIDLEGAARLLDGARLLVVNAASNVLGTRLPLRELAELAHDAGALVLLDAAQSAGHLPESPQEQGADIVAFTGHKGMLGPQGTGGLWIREGLDIHPLLTGGTGGNSMLREMPPSYPDHLEAGTPNAPGIAGLLAGCEYVLERGIADLHREESRLKARLREGLAAIPGVRVHSPPAPDGVGIVTITAETCDPPTLAQRLDDDWGVMTRPGLHCAPEAHRLLGTHETGALRFSLGWASTDEDVNRAVRGVEEILAQRAGAPAARTMKLSTEV
jgi:cysteine desulfurase / selenocysteine lyase